ncbi:unnamed protein product [Adineta steineri]|uniref:LEM domain-containing protein n=1 Tax=Adineta steineri TaxID=433720 RepID=A0A816AJS0_9BILA|nr:unnamed protein product [Adineta steineri]CAF1596686.1 unnamed protein product [Adineta steineri]
MSNKVDLQRKLKDIGYEIGQYASKDTLSNVIRLHSLALNKGIDVAKLNDLELRTNLIENGLTVGPVTGHTRAIYQRKLLETITNETTEGQEDMIEIDIPVSTTPPPRATRSSLLRNEDVSILSPTTRSLMHEFQEPRIPLNRVEIDDKNSRNLSSYYPNLSSTSKPKSDETITHSYSPQRSSTKPEPRNSNMSYGLRNPYDFQDEEPVVMRHEHKATPFRTTNVSSGETFSTNINRYTKQSDIQSTTRNDLSEIRSRILTNTNEQKDIKMNQDLPSKKTNFNNDSDIKKPANNEKLDVAVKNGGTFFYGGITVAIALIVFVLYLWLEK